MVNFTRGMGTCEEGRERGKANEENRALRGCHRYTQRIKRSFWSSSFTSEVRSIQITSLVTHITYPHSYTSIPRLSGEYYGGDGGMYPPPPPPHFNGYQPGSDPQQVVRKLILKAGTFECLYSTCSTRLSKILAPN